MTSILTLIFAAQITHATRPDVPPTDPRNVSKWTAPVAAKKHDVARGGVGIDSCEDRAGTISNSGSRPWMDLADQANPDVKYAGDRRMLDVLQRYLRICYTNVSSLLKSNGVVDPQKELANLVRRSDNPAEAREYLAKTYGLGDARAAQILKDLKDLNQLEARAAALTPQKSAALPAPPTSAR